MYTSPTDALSTPQIRKENVIRFNELKKREQLARNQLERLELELGESKRLLTKEVEARREQLNELCYVRETERQQWATSQRAEIQELEQRYEAALQQMQQEHAAAIEEQLFEQRRTMEKEYKLRLEQMNTKLEESQKHIAELQSTIEEAQLHSEHTRETLVSKHREEMDQLREIHQKDMLVLNEKLAQARAREKAAANSLRQREKLWANAMEKLQENQPMETKHLPIEVQSHMEATIEALRLQVELLQKRIILLREGNTTLPTNKEYGAHISSGQRAYDAGAYILSPVHTDQTYPITNGELPSRDLKLKWDNPVKPAFRVAPWIEEAVIKSAKTGDPACSNGQSGLIESGLQLYTAT
ncbi:unnamed protein product [Dicrocoelium dendriticum]|nr:unnamed protein product [Dicrocoelium dendriticum]